jgi:hypothetical protein
MSAVCEFLQRRVKAQAAGPDQYRAENLRLLVGKGAGKPAGDFLPAE